MLLYLAYVYLWLCLYRETRKPKVSFKVVGECMYIILCWINLINVPKGVLHLTVTVVEELIVGAGGFCTLMYTCIYYGAESSGPWNCLHVFFVCGDVPR